MEPLRDAAVERSVAYDSPAVSVVLCTYNPRADYLALALRSVGSQTLPSHLTEFIVVDNNSNPPLDQSRLERIAGIPVRLVHQPVQGLTHARIAGIKAAKADLLVFVDDDNELSHDYLDQAVKIAGDRVSVGVFGGVTDGVLERPVGRVKQRFLPQLGVRNYGRERIEGPGEYWGKWEPIGAGMVVRQVVARHFVSFVQARTSAGDLGRSGRTLMSGEDSLFSRLAHQIGYLCAYEPDLRLRHYISASRLKLRYLARLSYGHGRSFVLLNRLLGSNLDAKLPSSKVLHLLRNFRFRRKQDGLVEAAGMWFWDLGYLDELANG